MQLASFALSNFKEMVLQRSKNSSFLIWRKPTHQIIDMDETPRIPLSAKKIFTIIESRCTKMNLEVTTIVQHIKDCFCIFINN